MTLGLGIKNTNMIRRECPKCGNTVMRVKRPCCSARRRGVKLVFKCMHCGYSEEKKE